jgi:hypothetical protein
LQGEEKKELERRINRLEAILTRLVSELKKLKEN